VDNSQAKELVAQLKNPEADEIDQVIAFDTLICAKRVALRGIALRHGRKASSPDVRAQVLHRALFDMERIVFKLLPTEGLSKKQSDIVKNNPSWSYAVDDNSRFPNKNCIGFDMAFASECEDYALQITGNKVHVYYDDDLYDLELREDGRLVGQYRNRNWDDMAPLPVEIELQ
jgi:hypothetical protein